MAAAVQVEERVQEVAVRQFFAVCHEQLRIIRHNGAVVVIVGIALVDVVAHAGVEDEVHALFQQALNVTVRQLCRIADRVGRNGALSFIIRIPCALLGELHGKSQLCKERVPQGHLVVVVQRQRQSHRCLGLFRLVLCQ